MVFTRKEEMKNSKKGIQRRIGQFNQLPAGRGVHHPSVSFGSVLLIQTWALTPVATPGPAYRDGGLPRRVPVFQQGLGKLSLGHNLQKETKGKRYVCNSRPILKHSPPQNASLTAPPEIVNISVSI